MTKKFRKRRLKGLFGEERVLFDPSSIPSSRSQKFKVATKNKHREYPGNGERQLEKTADISRPHH